ncbi:hypothetical protein XBJ2_2110018 [Xenorhabdus bovienii str. Jollieti]|uniref:Uncharacterized protein n=1 Tax=Xenorhabdus bovienii (strain SS-2004) TaxID=406818 RepID=D3V6J2_XENBS|nr:hypothetical protein XBJ1_4159 [Xenorhabdus bovienii SS-2004]CDH29023.1 hypothetical protein XBJ2_2110018 [Xenorhabdus bovienii str. Jollieti]
MINVIFYNELVDYRLLRRGRKGGIAYFTLRLQGVKLITFPTIIL